MTEIPRMWWKPEDDRGPACLIIEANTTKRYQRLWFHPGGIQVKSIEWGWTLADTAQPLMLGTDTTSIPVEAGSTYEVSFDDRG